GCVQAGERKFIAHYLERHAQLSSAQLAGKENDKIPYREAITTQEMEMWDKRGELAVQTEQEVKMGSRRLAPRIFSQSWRMISNRSNDSGFSEGGRTVKSLPSQWESATCTIS
ncbi:hypothetical protein PMAYCL1PPCAC_14979, partial [Pristionchus mayeri]